MVNFAPAFLKQRSSLDLYIIPFIFDDIVQRTVNAIGFDINKIFIVNAGITISPIYLRTLRNVAMKRIFVKISPSVFDINIRIIFKYCGNIFVEIDPVFPVEEKDADAEAAARMRTMRVMELLDVLHEK